VLILDLRTHDEGWVRTKIDDRWLGFSESQLQELLSQAGFTHVTVRIGASTPGDPFTVLIAVGTTPAATRTRRRTGTMDRS
jgi:hypothetical protein